MNYKTKMLINSLTQNIIKSFNISTPIKNIDDCIELFGGEIQTTKDYDNGIIKKENSFIILISNYYNEKRRDFAVAQELGHLFLHLGYMTNDEIWQNKEDKFYGVGEFDIEKEYQANEFAMNFLILLQK